MAPSDQQDTSGAPKGAGDAEVEAAVRAVEEAASGNAAVSGEADAPGDDEPTVVAGVIPPLTSPERDGSAGGEETAVHATIPPLLTDVEDAGGATASSTPDAAPGASPDAPPVPVEQAGDEAPGASAGDGLAEDGSAARDRLADAAATVRERAAESTAAARERAADGAAHAREKGAEAAVVAKEKTSNARKRLSAAASEARERASSAASDARERASSADVKEFAHSTTSLIDTARPFFLAGAAAIFAVLGFLEGDSGVAQVFAIGALLFVIGAAFSGEINALLSTYNHARGGRPTDEE